jgi:hypothetical protein
MNALTKFKGFKNVTIDKIYTFIGYNCDSLTNGKQAIAVDKENAIVVLKCACWNCGDISTIDLTKAQIKKINKILKTK